MARTIEAIYNSIITAKEDESNLDGLEPMPETYSNLLVDVNAGSRVAHWRRWARIMAWCVWVLEKLFDQHKEEVDTLVNSLIPLSREWYGQMALGWQYGYSLVYLNSKYQFTSVDTAAQIIKRVSVAETSGNIVMKVAKLSGSTPVPLSTAEFNAFQAYMSRIGGAGDQLIIINQAPDKLKLVAVVYYDPSVITADGEEIATGDRTVDAAITAYIAGLPFDGKFRRNTLIDNVQLVEGVIDIKIVTLEAKYGTLSYDTVDVEYTPFAGHMEIDSAFPLATNVTYQIG